MVRRLFVYLDQISSFWVGFVSDRPAFVEFEEDRWVYLAQFALSGSKFTVEGERRGFGGKDCWTVTEQLPASV